VDLTPRPAPEQHEPQAKARTRRWVPGVVLGVILLAAAVILFQGLSNATLYFYNVDEAVEQKADLGQDRFRLQGVVVPGSIVSSDTGTVFEVEYDGVTVVIDHDGDPPDLFQECIPVVAEGRWSGDVFASDRIMVKHSSEYEAKNPDRLETGC